MAVNPTIVQNLKETLQLNPTATELSLQFMQISNLLPYLHILAQFKNLKRLSLHGNRLKQLPTDLSMLKNLEQLDLSNNMLTDVQMALISLKTMPKLINLVYPAPKDKEKKICQELKALKFLNNAKIGKQGNKKSKSHQRFNEKSLKQYSNKVILEFKQLLKLQAQYNDYQFEDNSEEETKFKDQISLILSQSLAKFREIQSKNSPSLESLILSTTKHQMYQIIKDRSINLCADVYSDLGNFLKNLFNEQNNLFKEIASQSLTLMMELNTKKNYQQQNYKQNSNSISSSVNLSEKVQFLQKEVKRLRRQKEQLNVQISVLDNLNNKYINSFVRLSKGQKIPIGTFMNRQNGAIDNNKNIRSNFTNNPKTEKNQKNKQISLSSNYSTNGRSLTLKQLKETIQDIYESKLKFDQRNFDGKLPRQTMNQYLFTYLNQKYGLKSLTIEAANSIISGIQSYSAEDNDVAVFGKILRNELDQQFRTVQKDLKSTINDLLKMHIKTKMPYKSANEINDIFNEKINNEIGYEETEDLVKYLYEAEDAYQILQRLDVFFKLNTKKGDDISVKRLTREQQQAVLNQKVKRKIRFNTFVQCVLDFQMKKHQKLLRPLIKTFKIYDLDNDGIVDEDQFINIIERLCEEAEEIIPKLLFVVDPYETKSITFTQIVRLIANYPENNPILSRFIDQEHFQNSIEDD